MNDSEDRRNRRPPGAACLLIMSWFSVVSLLLCGDLFAQTEPPVVGEFGHAPDGNTQGAINGVTRLGDINGDGIPEFLLSNSLYANDTLALSGAGVLYITNSMGTGPFGGPNGLPGPPVDVGDYLGGSLGYSVAALEDVDGDGLRDFAAMIVDNATQTDELRVYSSVTLARIGTMSFPGPLNRCCWSLGDINADGVGDWLVSTAVFLDSATNLFGVLSVVSGATRTVIRTHFDPTVNLFPTVPGGGGFGAFCSALGDQDGDGVIDYGTTRFLPGNGQGRRVVVYSGATGAAIENVDIDDNLVFPAFSGINGVTANGLGLQEIGDITGDGRSEIGFATGERTWHVVDLSVPALVYSVSPPSGITGSPNPTFDFPVVRRCNDDVDGDGTEDFYMSDRATTLQNGDVVGEVVLFSGANGSALANHVGDCRDAGFGGSMAVVGDLNLDGIPECVVGPRGVFTNFAQVISLLGGWKYYGPPITTLNLSWTRDGSPNIGGVMSLTGAVPFGVVDYLLSTQRDELIVGNPPVPILVSIPDVTMIGFGGADSMGTLDFYLPLDLPVLAGEQVHLQWFDDNSMTISASNGLTLRFR